MLQAFFLLNIAHFMFLAVDKLVGVELFFIGLFIY